MVEWTELEDGMKLIKTPVKGMNDYLPREERLRRKALAAIVKWAGGELFQVNVPYRAFRLADGKYRLSLLHRSIVYQLQQDQT